MCPLDELSLHAFDGGWCWNRPNRCGPGVVRSAPRQTAYSPPPADKIGLGAANPARASQRTPERRTEVWADRQVGWMRRGRASGAGWRAHEGGLHHPPHQRRSPGEVPSCRPKASAKRGGGDGDHPSGRADDFVRRALELNERCSSLIQTRKLLLKEKLALQLPKNPTMGSPASPFRTVLKISPLTPFRLGDQQPREPR
jgi:hypothetical protein